MKFTIATLSVLVASALAVPYAGSGSSDGDDDYVPCSGAEDTPLCCAVNVLGVISLDCESPPSTPTSASDFQDICADDGLTAGCCLLSVAGQALICEKAPGTT